MKQMIRKAKMTKHVLACSIALAFTLAGSAQAAALNFSPTGNGVAGAFSVGTLDIPPTGFLALGGKTAIAGGIGSTFEVLMSGSINNITDPSGNDITPFLLDSGFELTFIAKLTERVTGFTGPQGARTGVNFSVDAGSPAFFKMYYDSSVDKSYLTGSGFNDGVLIASSTSVGSVSGTYTANAAVGLLDKSGANDYSGQSSRSDRGSAIAPSFTGFTVDPAFFTNAQNGLTIRLGLNAASMPFASVNPPDCFTRTPLATAVGSSNAFFACDTAHVNGLYSVQSALANGVVPSTGSTNGIFGVASGSDFVAQTDPAMTAVVGAADIAEPGSVALIGAGLTAFGWAARRRFRKVHLAG
jgi:hypothetical protein